MNNLDKFYTEKISDFSKSYFSYISSLLEKINNNECEKLVKEIIKARDRNSNIFFIGNGGSASTASHFSNDISIGTKSLKKPFKAISLTDNQAIITALANDYGYEKVFEYQLRNLANKNDLLIVISASGNSKNLIEAIKYAKNKGIISFSITAFDGGIIKDLADYNLHVYTEINEYGPAEDIHMMLAGMIGSYLNRFIYFES